MSKTKFTKEGSIDVQVSFQEIWGQMPIDKRNELFDRFVHVAEFLESLVLIAPSNRDLQNGNCSRIECQDKIKCVYYSVEAYVHRLDCEEYCA